MIFKGIVKQSIMILITAESACTLTAFDVLHMVTTILKSQIIAGYLNLFNLKALRTTVTVLIDIAPAAIIGSNSTP